MNKKNITGYHLKLIALITMLVDHTAAVLLWRLYVASYHISGTMQRSEAWRDRLIVWIAEHQEVVYSIYENMRLIGRMAFPIYCFLLVEGFLYTRSVKKYAIRLLGFAFISEIPFDLAIRGTVWDSMYSNVFFTLFLALLAIWVISYIEKFYEFWKEKQWDIFFGSLMVGLMGIFVLAVFGGLAEWVLCSDYGFAGVLAIVVMYLFRKTKEAGFIAGVFALSVFSSTTEIAALCMLYPLVRYDGTRGKNMKYVFYAFYPVHLLILAGMCILLGV